MKNYHLQPKLLLRTPLLAQNTYIAKILKTNDLAMLKTAFQDIILQEALFLASPVLYEECIKWLRGDIVVSEELHLAQGLWRYLLRMSSRCTPFGLFAGVSVGEWSNENNVTLGQVADNQRNTRADMEYLGALAQHLSQQTDIRAQLRFYPNNSLYESGEKLRYVDYHYDGKRRVHQIVAIDNSVYVQAVLDAARQGATPSDLTKSIVSDDISEAEALDFIHEMIASQVLISELDGKVTGNPSLTLPKGKGTKNVVNFTPTLFSDFVKGLQDIDNQSLGVSPEQYKALAKSLDELAVPYELNRLFQTDLEKPTLQCSLDKKIAGSLRKGLSLLNRLAVAPRETNLKKFADAFSERYETQELPLLDVLDVETGIGYLQISDTQGDINPLVDDLMIGSVGSSAQNIHWDSRQAFLFKKLLKATQQNDFEVRLEAKELETFEEKWEDVSPSISVMFSSLNNGDVILKHAGGSATRLLGRFSCMSESIYDWLNEIADAEQSNTPNAIIAEIVHLPENRVGNILMRKNFRAYEIPYLAQSSVSEEFQIPLQDLMVSVQN